MVARADNHGAAIMSYHGSEQNSIDYRNISNCEECSNDDSDNDVVFSSDIK